MTSERSGGTAARFRRRNRGIPRRYSGLPGDIRGFEAIEAKILSVRGEMATRGVLPAGLQENRGAVKTGACNEHPLDRTPGDYPGVDAVYDHSLIHRDFRRRARIAFHRRFCEGEA